MSTFLTLLLPSTGLLLVPPPAVLLIHGSLAHEKLALGNLALPVLALGSSLPLPGSLPAPEGSALEVLGPGSLAPAMSTHVVLLAALVVVEAHWDQASQRADIGDIKWPIFGSGLAVTKVGYRGWRSVGPG